jgi:hypothetical protein
MRVMDGIGTVSTNLPNYADDQSMTSVKLRVSDISKPCTGGLGGWTELADRSGR